MNEKITRFLHSACSLLVGINVIMLCINFDVFIIPFYASIVGVIVNYV